MTTMPRAIPRSTLRTMTELMHAVAPDGETVLHTSDSGVHMQTSTDVCQVFAKTIGDAGGPFSGADVAQPLAVKTSVLHSIISASPHRDVFIERDEDHVRISSDIGMAFRVQARERMEPLITATGATLRFMTYSSFSQELHGLLAVSKWASSTNSEVFSRSAVVGDTSGVLSSANTWVGSLRVLATKRAIDTVFRNFRVRSVEMLAFSRWINAVGYGATVSFRSDAGSPVSIAVRTYDVHAEILLHDVYGPGLETFIKDEPARVHTSTFEPIIMAADAIKSLASDNTDTVTVSSDDLNLTLHAHTADGDAMVTVPISGRHEPSTISVNARGMREMLLAINSICAPRYIQIGFHPRFLELRAGNVIGQLFAIAK